MIKINKPEELLDLTVITVKGEVATVYLNKYRIAGRKVYPDEASVTRKFTVTLNDINKGMAVDICTNIKHTWVDGICAQCGKKSLL